MSLTNCLLIKSLRKNKAQAFLEYFAILIVIGAVTLALINNGFIETLRSYGNVALGSVADRITSNDHAE